MLTRIQRGDYRFYRDDQTGKEYISVTSCLSLLPKPGLIQWAVMQTVKFIADKKVLSNKVFSEAFVIHKKILQILADAGTEDHNEIEYYLKTGEIKDDPSVKRFREWESESGFKIEQIELTVYSDKLMSAGTADLIGRCSEVSILLDLKTSKSIRLSHKIQAAIYKYMLGEPNRKAAILLIPRDAKKKVQFYILTEEEEKTYLKIYFLLVNLFYLLFNLGELSSTRKS